MTLDNKFKSYLKKIQQIVTKIKQNKKNTKISPSTLDPPKKRKLKPHSRENPRISPERTLKFLHTQTIRTGLYVNVALCGRVRLVLPVHKSRTAERFARVAHINLMYLTPGTSRSKCMNGWWVVGDKVSPVLVLDLY